MKKLLLSLALGTLGVTNLAHGATPARVVQTYFVPLPENELFTSMKTISGDTGGYIQSTISIAIASNGTKIYYDHWEDGYDFAPSGPNATSTTQIWGDGDTSNGIAPGYPNDIVYGGSVIILDNQVPIPRVETAVRYDGGDRISATLPIAVTRSAYPQTPGSLLAGAVEVFNRDNWGRSFVSPVSNGWTNGTGAFEYAKFFIMAGYDKTEVSVNGVLTFTLDTGMSVVYNCSIGDVITSTRDVQLTLVSGDIGSKYEMRWFAQVDSRDWSNEYYSPVAETQGTTGFWFHNQNNVSISIKIEGYNMINSGLLLSVPAGTTKFIECKAGAVANTIQIKNGAGNDNTTTASGTAFYTGLRFSTSGLPFYGLAQIDADGIAANDGQLYDWGFPLIPSNRLTSQALVGRGDGCTSVGCTLMPGRIGEDRSVVSVTPVNDTYIFVDYNGDGIFDANFFLKRLASLRLVDAVDHTLTGAIIAASVGRNATNNNVPEGIPVQIAVAWGQDPVRSFSNDNDGMDLGTAVLPLANPFVSKQVEKVENPNGSLDPFSVVDEVGDKIFYVISVSNVGFRELTGVTINDPMISGSLVGPTESSNTDGILVRGETWTYTGTYTVTQADIDTKGGGDSNIENVVSVKVNSFPSVIADVETPIFLVSVSGTVKEDLDNNNTGDIPLANVIIALTKIGSGVVKTTLTDLTGFYAFDDVPAGDYVVTETNLNSSYSDVSDADGGTDLNKITILGIVGSGLNYTGNDFVDERLGAITGSVKDDDGGPIPDVELQLFDFTGTVVATTSTDSSGLYIFSNLGPSNYTIVEPFLPNYPIDILDQDNSNDGDAEDADETTDNQITVTLKPGETDSDNDFVDSNKGSITGNVQDESGVPLEGVIITLKNQSGIVATTITGPAGTYIFTNLKPGEYTVTEQNLPGYTDLSDRDTSNDGDVGDSDTTVDNTIHVTLSSGETDKDNNFVDTLFSATPSVSPSAAPSGTPTKAPRGSIMGSVKEDINGDGTGDVGVPGILITLTNASGSVIITTLTDSNGEYTFADIKDGTYFVVQTNKDGTYRDVSDSDGGPDLNSVTVTLTGGNGAGAIDFVDERPGSITGSVKDDQGNPISAVVLTLSDSTSAVVATTATDSTGAYSFSDLSPGVYTVTEPVLAAFPTDVLDQDQSPDAIPDPQDSDVTVDNSIGVKLLPAEVDSGNNFVDSNKGRISGSVKDDAASPIPGVILTLTNSDNESVTTMTDSNGEYYFDSLPPGDYTVTEQNLPGYTDLSDRDTSNDGDVGDSDTTVDNAIRVTLKSGEMDEDNNFVDYLSSAMPSVSPSAAPSGTPTKAPRGSIMGSVKEDINGDGTGDVGVTGILITLTNASGSVIITTLTDSNGEYTFADIKDGTYFVVQTNKDGTYRDVSDSDGGPDLNSVTVTLTGGNGAGAIDFVDERPGSITGSVKDDQGNPISAVVLTLSDSTSAVVATTATDSTGAYSFSDLSPGVYTVTEPVLAAFPTDVLDQDQSPDAIPDPPDSDVTVDNSIGVKLLPAEVDSGNNFVDSNKGRISGSVKDDAASPIPGVILMLTNSDNESVTTMTDSNGEYYFDSLPPGDYTVTEQNLPGYTDLSDRDTSNDGDVGDSDTTVDNAIRVTLKSGEMDEDNNFVDYLSSAMPSVSPSAAPSGTPTKAPRGSIMGSVKEDINGDGTGDVGVPGILITLTNASGSVIITTLTDSNGEYTFADIKDGTYFVVQTNKDGTYRDVSDSDGGPDLNSVTVTLTGGNGAGAIDFVDERPGSITGSVKDDQGNPIPAVVLSLSDSTSAVVATTATDSTGAYSFSDLSPGVYTVTEPVLAAFPTDVLDQDQSPDAIPDPQDSDVTVDNSIGVKLLPAEVDSGNNFVDSNKGRISGSVKDDAASPIPGVILTLTNSDNESVTTTTDSNGEYYFDSLPPGDYTVTEQNLPGYTDLSDRDTSNDGDVGDSDTTVDNAIRVTLKSGEMDEDNNFVDYLSSAMPSVSPSATPSGTPTKAPRGSIMGSVKEDINGDGTGDVGVPGILITLTNASGSVIITTLTDSNGEYTFADIKDGTYFVVQTNKDGTYRDVSDSDGGPDLNSVTVTLTGGNGAGAIDFVDERPGSITGSVKDDQGNPIPAVVLSLSDSTSAVVATTATDSTGAYSFSDLSPGVYTVTEPVLAAFPTDVLDQDQSPDAIPDPQDSDVTVDNSIGVKLLPAEVDSGNNFVDSNKGRISGSVKDDAASPIPGVILMLTNSDNESVTTTTDSNGEYYFDSLPPGDYTVTEQNLPGYTDLSDRDTSNDGDVGDSDTTVDNAIRVTLKSGEMDEDNNFVDYLSSAMPSVSPSAAPSGTPTKAPRGSIMGSVKEDINGDGTGDVGVPGILITLTNASGSVIITTLTDSNGEYTFADIKDGTYFVVQTNKDGTYRDVSDSDGGPDLNSVTVTLTGGNGAGAIDFVDERPGSITGSVKDDQGNPIPAVVLTLSDSTSAVVATTATDSTGAYSFSDLSPGVYTVTEPVLAAFPTDVLDQDQSPDAIPDPQDSDVTVDNSIGVKLLPAEVDSGNNFVDSNKGRISGSVKDDAASPIPGVILTLTNSDNESVTTMTDSNGEYYFDSLPPGDYTVTEQNLPGYTDLSDRDTSNDGDVGDSDTTVDNAIRVTLKSGEMDEDNNFVDYLSSAMPSVSPSAAPSGTPTKAPRGSIMGSVKEDINGDGTGDVGVPGILITLTNASGSVIITTLTDSNGEYTFADIKDGTYFVVQTNKDGTYRDVSDSDGGPDLNSVTVTLTGGNGAGAIDFVDERPGSITGSVKDDQGNPIPAVVLSLSDSTSAVVATTATDSTGAYSFSDLSPGVYTVTEPVLAAFPTDVLDQDQSPDAIPDPQDSDVTVDNSIGVKLLPAEVDSGNNFVDSNKGRISGSVKDDAASPIPGVILTLTNSDNESVTTMTDSNGEYYFDNLPPGDYTVTEQNLPGYTDLIDRDTSNDGDVGDSDTTVDNAIRVTLKSGEMDTDNNFVDKLLSSSPSTSPSAGLQTAPPGGPFDFCCVVPNGQCNNCAPYRSLDYCATTESFPALIQSRTSQMRTDATGLESNGWWFQYLEDKIAAYLLTATSGVPAPEVFCCVTQINDLANELTTKVTSGGIVIKATNFHSNQGIYVLTNYSTAAIMNPSAPYLFDVMTKLHRSYNDVLAELSFLQATKIIVEEFIGSTLPVEYKFHVMNGTVAAIDIIADRDGDCPCYAVVDTNWNRLDKFGCFEPGMFGMQDSEDCTVIDFTTGKAKCGPIKKDLYLCADLPTLPPCLLQDMIEAAIRLGDTIGVYMRVDMFVAGDQYYVQEYTPNHMNGIRHCAAKQEPDGCIDSCFMGRMYAGSSGSSSSVYGGVQTPVPSILSNYAGLTPQQQCDKIVGVTAPVARTTC